MGGQLIFLITHKYSVPTQFTVTVANIDTYRTHRSQTVAFRVWPLGHYQEPTKYRITIQKPPRRRVSPWGFVVG